MKSAKIVLKPGGPNYRPFFGGRTRAEEPASLPRAILVTDGIYPYLVVAPDIAAVNDRVQGVLITVEPEHYLETLQRVDWLEDYKPLSSLSLYERVSRVVETKSGPVEAWMYVAGPWVLKNARNGRLSRVASGVWHV